MVVRFNNFTDEVRNSIENDIDYIHGISKGSSVFDQNIYKYFRILKEKNYSCYKQVLGLLLSDHYKLLYDKTKTADLSDFEKTILSLYADLYDNDSVVCFLEADFDIFVQSLYEMSEFNNIDYFTKREIYINCKDILEKLGIFSFFNVLDYLYYCQKYNTDILRLIYNQNMNIGETNEFAVSTLAATIEELCVSDTSNYVELMSDLLVQYYKIGRQQLCNVASINKVESLNKTMNLLESKSYIDILNTLNDNVIMQEILNRFVSVKNDEINYKLDEKDDKIIKKLIKMKEIM